MRKTQQNVAIPLRARRRWENPLEISDTRPEAYVSLTACTDAGATRGRRNIRHCEHIGNGDFFSAWLHKLEVPAGFVLRFDLSFRHFTLRLMIRVATARDAVASREPRDKMGRDGNGKPNNKDLWLLLVSTVWLCSTVLARECLQNCQNKSRWCA